MRAGQGRLGWASGMGVRAGAAGGTCIILGADCSWHRPGLVGACADSQGRHPPRRCQHPAPLLQLHGPGGFVAAAGAAEVALLLHGTQVCLVQGRHHLLHGLYGWQQGGVVRFRAGMTGLHRPLPALPASTNPAPLSGQDRRNTRTTRSASAFCSEDDIASYGCADVALSVAQPFSDGPRAAPQACAVQHSAA